MSATRIVPVAVPSLFHNSSPLVPLFALKYSTPFTFVRFPRLELPAPARMSAKRTVPVSVPSLFHNS